MVKETDNRPGAVKSSRARLRQLLDEALGLDKKPPPFKVKATNLPQACLDKLNRWRSTHGQLP